MLGQASVRSDQHPGVLDCSIRIEKLGPDGADTIDRHPAHHLFQPAGT